MLSPHDRKLKQIQKVPQFNQSLQKKKNKQIKKEKNQGKSYSNIYNSENKKQISKKSSQKEKEFQQEDLTKEMNDFCESDRLKCQDEIQKTLSERFEQSFLNSLQEPVQVQDIIYSKENVLDKLFSSFKSVKVQSDLNYDSLFFNSTKDKNFDSVKVNEQEQLLQDKLQEETTNDKSHSFVKTKNEQKEEYIENNEIQNFQQQNLQQQNEEINQIEQQENFEQNQKKEDLNQENLDFLNDQKLDQMIQHQSEKFEQSFDTQTKFSKIFEKYKQKSKESNDQNNQQKDTQQNNINEKIEQEEDFLRLEKELNITPNDSIEHEQKNQKKKKYDSSKFEPAQIEHIQQQQDEFEDVPRVPSFAVQPKEEKFQENFNFQENEENQDILQEINRIYKNSQKQVNVDSIKSQYRTNGSFTFAQQDFLEKQQDLSKIIEEGEEKHNEEHYQDQEIDEQIQEKVEVFTLGGANQFQESEREIENVQKVLPQNLQQNTTNHNAYYSDAVNFQTKQNDDTKQFKSVPLEKEHSYDEEQIRTQKFDELIEKMLKKKVQRIIQFWKNYKSPLNQKKYVGRFFDLFWNTYYDDDLVDSFNEGKSLTIIQLQKIKNEFWIYLKENMNISKKDFDIEINKLSFFNQFNQIYVNY